MSLWQGRFSYCAKQVLSRFCRLSYNKFAAIYYDATKRKGGNLKIATPRRESHGSLQQTGWYALLFPCHEHMCLWGGHSCQCQSRSLLCQPQRHADTEPRSLQIPGRSRRPKTPLFRQATSQVHCKVKAVTSTVLEQRECKCQSTSHARATCLPFLYFKQEIPEADDKVALVVHLWWVWQPNSMLPRQVKEPA